jgi:hypothetical protein
VGKRFIFKVRQGYIFLLSVLVIGAIATSTALSLVLLGLASEQSGFNIVQSMQAYEHANTCVERALRTLRSDLTYEGDVTAALTNGSCTLKKIGGTGNADRIICSEGRSGQSVRRLEVYVREIFPRVKIASWKEVDQFLLCP